ncbi:hypothetical protein BDV19DRAFT_285130 [Aspergillus venezuelensis]
MKLTTPLLALSLALSASASAIQHYIGCYSDSGQLKDQGSYTYQSNGYCLNLCYRLGRNYFALNEGDRCYCGDVPPSEDDRVAEDKCNRACAAWPVVKCGGDRAWSLYSTGYGSYDESPNASTSDSVIITSTASSTIKTRPSTTRIASSATPSSENASSTSVSVGVEPTPKENKASRRYSFLF